MNGSSHTILGPYWADVLGAWRRVATGAALPFQALHRSGGGGPGAARVADPAQGWFIAALTAVSLSPRRGRLGVIVVRPAGGADALRYADAGGTPFAGGNDAAGGGFEGDPTFRNAGGCEFVHAGAAVGSVGVDAGGGAGGTPFPPGDDDAGGGGVRATDAAGGAFVGGDDAAGASFVLPSGHAGLAFVDEGDDPGASPSAGGGFVTGSDADDDRGYVILVGAAAMTARGAMAGPVAVAPRAAFDGSLVY